MLTLSFNIVIKKCNFYLNDVHSKCKLLCCVKLFVDSTIYYDQKDSQSDIFCKKNVSKKSSCEFNQIWERI